MNGWIFMILTHMIDTNENIKLTQGQGHRVKGQGQIKSYVKTLVRLKIMNGRFDLNEIKMYD